MPRSALSRIFARIFRRNRHTLIGFMNGPFIHNVLSPFRVYPDTGRAPCPRDVFVVRPLRFSRTSGD